METVTITRKELRLICKRLREYESTAARRMKDDGLNHRVLVQERARGRRDAFRSARKLMRGLFLMAGIERTGT
jgi:hypothetical protein